MKQFDHVYNAYQATRSLYDEYLDTFLKELKERYPTVVRDMGMSREHFCRCQRAHGDLYNLIFWYDPGKKGESYEFTVDSVMLTNPKGPEFKEFFDRVKVELVQRGISKEREVKKDLSSLRVIK